jgi:tRNA pseudouridine55 synthase
MAVKNARSRAVQTRPPKLEGLLNIDKPPGWTSHDVVAKIRTLLGVRKVGHTGTLDPMATGVLLVCVGAATRGARFLVGLEKAYTAAMILGGESDTLDATGQVRMRNEPLSVTTEQIEKVFQEFTGTIDQIPPMYSAVKYKGQPLYRLARRGQTVPRRPRTVTIRSLTIENTNLPEVVFTTVCSSGTYIRSLVADIGRRLGCGAYLKTLTRIRLGSFRLEQALSMDAAARMSDQGTLGDQLIPLVRGLDSYQLMVVSPSQLAGVRNGRPITGEKVRRLDPQVQKNDVVRLEDPDGRLLAMVQMLIGHEEIADLPPERPVCRYLRVLI